MWINLRGWLCPREGTIRLSSSEEEDREEIQEEDGPSSRL